MIVPRLKSRIAFFDRSVIKRNWRKINESPLKKAGLLIRRIARGSIRRATPKKGSPFQLKKSLRPPSKPPRPPKSWKGGGTPPFKMIYSVPEKLGTSVIVGMVGFGGKGEPVPGLHERGGRAIRRVFIKTEMGRDIKGRFTKRKRRIVRRMVKYPERPFMEPAKMKALPRLPSLWRTSFSSG